MAAAMAFAHLTTTDNFCRVHSVISPLLRREPLIALDLQGRLRVAHRERRVSHVLPEFTFRHRARFLIPDVRGNLPRRIWPTIDCDSQHHEFAVAKRCASTLMFECFEKLSLRSTDSHVAARIALTIFEWEVGQAVLRAICRVSFTSFGNRINQRPPSQYDSIPSFSSLPSLILRFTSVTDLRK